MNKLLCTPTPRRLVKLDIPCIDKANESLLWTTRSIVMLQFSDWSIDGIPDPVQLYMEQKDRISVSGKALGLVVWPLTEVPDSLGTTSRLS